MTERTSIARIQIAGVCHEAEARMLADCGVQWIGIPLRLPVNQEDITDDEARAIVASCSDLDVAFVLITYLQSADEIIQLARFLGVQHVQIHGDIALAEMRRLRTSWPEACLLKSLVLRSNNEMQLRLAVRAVTPYVDAFITDTFDPVSGASGATGLTHDWGVSRALVDLSPRPVILAGGLTPANLSDAIATVRPHGVDAHTGVEAADGSKDRQKVRDFVQAAKRAYGRLEG